MDKAVYATNKISVLSYQGFKNKDYDEEKLHNSIMTRLDHYTNIPFENINELEIKDHAFERWNTRVGPIFETKEQIIENHMIIFKNFNRVRIISSKYQTAMIDDDIIFAYDFDKKRQKLIITTYYGRVSLNPRLHDFRYMRYVNSNRGERFLLSQPENVLEEQILPPIPQELMKFKGQKADYLIEKYTANGKPVYYATSLNYNNYGKVIKVNLNNIEKTTRRAIMLFENHNV